jgi:hypothetical protein
MTLWGISDSELLAMVDDLADEDGWVTTVDVRLQLGENTEDVGHRSGVPTRLAWMRRYGWLERGERHQWRLTAVGHALIENPKLAKGVEASLAKLNPGQRIAAAREIAEAGNAGAGEIRDALRRQWQRSMQIGRRR